MKICEVCGQPITYGCMTDGDGDLHVHPGPCFDFYMDDTYGEHQWMVIDDTNYATDGCGGYYIVADPNERGFTGTGIYYTEYEEPDDEDDDEPQAAPNCEGFFIDAPLAEPGGGSLTPVNIPEGISKVGRAYFTDRLPMSFVIREGCDHLKGYVFRGCESLATVHLPRGIKRINSGSFKDCRNLTSVYIPDSVKTIGEEAFAGCTSLKWLRIPASVTSIEEDCFKGCPGFTLYAPEGSYADSYAQENNFVEGELDETSRRLQFPREWIYQGDDDEENE